MITVIVPEPARAYFSLKLSGMKTLLTIIIVALLLLNGATATYGGLNLMLCPDGSSLYLPPDLLAGTPFTDYFIPGLLLLLTNGLPSLGITYFFIAKGRTGSWLVKIQGLLLCGYIIIQVLLIEVVLPLHFICGGAGLLLILCAWLLEAVSTGRHAKKIKQAGTRPL